MQECIQIPELLAKIAQKKAQGLTAERVAFSFMKRRVQPLMQREHLGFEYTGADDGSRLSAEEISDDLVMERLQKIFKNLHEIPAAVQEYSADNPPRMVSFEELAPEYLL